MADFKTIITTMPPELATCLSIIIVGLICLVICWILDE